jgi:Ca2+-binding RTX toxin-like protein
VHHLDGQFILVITPVGTTDYGNRLRGLVPGGISATQFTYQNFRGVHGSPNITGTPQNDLLSGSDGANNITGGFGQDSILAFAGDDVVDGGDDADFIFPGSGNDTVSGGPGDDVIGTAAGLDIIHGGDGNDYIRGSGDKDTMDGGPGGDIFAYATFSDSNPGTARDQITDFNPFEDKIDLSLIDAKPKAAGNQAFTWIGWNKTLRRPGQLTAARSGSNIIVKANSDTDRAAELEIRLSNVSGQLSASAFIP